MTLLEAVNKVLLKLRMNQVTSITTNEHSQLIAALVNETRLEIEDAWNWLELRTTVQVNTTATFSQYTLSNVKNSRFKLIEVINDTDDYYLKSMSSTELTKRFLFGDPQAGKPLFYGFNGFDFEGNPIVDIYPIPDTVYSINFNIVLPQNEIINDSEQIKVPGHLVVLGTYVKALAERGEDASNGYIVARAIYQDALASNISQQEALMGSETDWIAV